jgi:nitrite reductase/ring-hydroxylating ferredoxin subunit
MAAPERLICASNALIDSGEGVRFEVERGGETVPAFAVRYEGQAHAYLNRCAHQPMELDWKPGRFFDAEGLLLVCSTHGAEYAPDTGACLGGPCTGALVRLAVSERGGCVYWMEQD